MESIEDSIRPEVERFFKTTGYTRQAIVTTSLAKIINSLINHIETGTLANGKPWKYSTKKTYAFGIIKVLSRLRNERIENMPTIQAWTNELLKGEKKEPKNSAPIVELSTIESVVMRICPLELMVPVRDLLHLQWLTAARSTTALKGLGIVGDHRGMWRYSWQEHKTDNVIHIRDHWVSYSEMTDYLRSRVKHFPSGVKTLYPVEVINEASIIISKALNNRQMSVRRSAAQETMAITNSYERVKEKLNHTDVRTTKIYLSTRRTDLLENTSQKDF